MSVIWHDLECGGYTEDLPLWRELAGQEGDPVLDIGAGTGRVALDLARAGHHVTALDHDGALLAELERRAAGLPVNAVRADARAFVLAERFSLCLVPMQTVQLLGGAQERGRCLGCLRDHLRPDGLLALAIAEVVELYDVGAGAATPLPDVLERDGTVYFSQPTAVRAGPDGFVLERRRERVSVQGEHTVQDDAVRLDALTGAELEAEGRAVGLKPAGRVSIEATAEHVGSTVVMFRG